MLETKPKRKSPPVLKSRVENTQHSFWKFWNLVRSSDGKQFHNWLAMMMKFGFKNKWFKCYLRCSNFEMRLSRHQLLAGFVLDKCHKLPDVPAISNHLRSNWCPRILLVEQRNLFPQRSNWRLWLGLYSTRSKKDCPQHLIDILGWRSLHSHLEILMNKGCSGWSLKESLTAVESSHSFARSALGTLGFLGTLWITMASNCQWTSRKKIASDKNHIWYSSTIELDRCYNHVRAQSQTSTYHNMSTRESIRNFPRAGWRLIFGVENKKGPWLEILGVKWCGLNTCFV